jgi:hypothetical protein
VALVTDHDHLAVATGKPRVAVLARRVEPPLQDVARDEGGVGNDPVVGTLGLRADVDQASTLTRGLQRPAR